MSDPYVPQELDYKLARQALSVIKEHRLPVFILTKSNLVLRDLDLLADIAHGIYACVAFTITTADDDLARKVEPYAPIPSKRFEALGYLSAAGIKTGVNIMPLLPFIEDNIANLMAIIDQAVKAKVDFVLPSMAVTLRDRQRQYFYDRLDEQFPGVKEKYLKTFGNRYACVTPKAKILTQQAEALIRQAHLFLRDAILRERGNVSTIEFLRALG